MEGDLTGSILETVTTQGTEQAATIQLTGSLLELTTACKLATVCLQQMCSAAGAGAEGGTLPRGSTGFSSLFPASGASAGGNFGAGGAGATSGGGPGAPLVSGGTGTSGGGAAGVGAASPAAAGPGLAGPGFLALGTALAAFGFYKSLPLLQGGFGNLGNAIGGGFTSGGFGLDTFVPNFFHRGGRVTRGKRPTRASRPEGLRSDEVAATLQVGERVIPRGQSSGSDAPTVNFTQVINTPDIPAFRRSARSNLRSGAKLARTAFKRV